MELTRSDLSALAELIAREVQARLLATIHPGRWMTLKEAMAYAKVGSVNTIKEWIRQGYIYGHKRTGHWIVDRESIDEWFMSESIDRNMPKTLSRTRSSGA